jgi:hypothetical protein
MSSYDNNTNFTYKTIDLYDILEKFHNDYIYYTEFNFVAQMTFSPENIYQYKILYLSKFANLPNQTLGYQNNGVDIGSLACPRYTRYTSNNTHTCHSKTTKVYLVLVGGGGGGGGGGANHGWGGAGGGGGGGGGMLALMLQNNAGTNAGTIAITIGTGGPRGEKFGNNEAGQPGTNGNATTATIGSITATADGGYGGGGGGGGGGDNRTGNETGGTKGGGGSRGISTASYTNDNSYNGDNGIDGDNGIGGNNDDDYAYGGDGGVNGYSKSNTFSFESSFTYGNGGKGGQGDQWSSYRQGAPGTAGNAGVAYIFEYFD